MASPLKRIAAPRSISLIREQVWTRELAEALLPLCDEFTPLSWYEDGVRSGRLATMTGLDETARRVGAVLWRIDFYKEKKCFVVVAAVGWHPVFDLIGSVLPALEEMARGHGCEGFRFHTRRPGLARIAVLNGYAPVEYVFRKALA
jgi:hypothetical protein